MQEDIDKLIEKYNRPAPRYTSYPTFPYWEEPQMPADVWLHNVKYTFNATNVAQGLSLYIHLPYCESLCTYCACNTRVTKNHTVEEEYINALLKEWEIYCKAFGDRPIIKEIHLGGGTPTFFSPEHLQRLVKGIMKNAEKHDKFIASFEGHPNNTSRDHLQAMYEVGFRRVSFGVQDLDLKVQKTINRVQPFENVHKVIHYARAVGYESINIDLIYGLPFQTEHTVRDTIEKVTQLMPERIAFYSYAHVPWKRPGQRAYTEADLPDSSYKRKLYEVGKQIFLDEGYIDVGMDHFALSGDALYQAYQNKTMHRNFMGYTHSKTSLLIGLGASAISESCSAYTQNVKNVEEYKALVNSGSLPLTKGHQLSKEDNLIRGYIMDILCNGEVHWEGGYSSLDINGLIGLHTMADEGIVKLYETGFRVTVKGMPFLRNICMLFDQYLQQGSSSSETRFSKAI